MELDRLGEQIRTVREAKHLSLGHTADLCEMHKSHLSRIERGKTNPNLDVLLKICDVLDCELAWIERRFLLSMKHPLTSRIFMALDPPRNDRTYARLFGAVVALLVSWEIMLRNPPPKLRVMQERWKWDELLPDLRRSIEEKGHVDWELTETLIPWSMGFFQNNAQERLMLVLNRCVFWWLVTKRPEEEDQHRRQNFRAQLASLRRSRVVSTQGTEMAHELWRAFEQCEHVKGAVNRVQRLTGRSKQNTEATTVEELIDHHEMPTGAECMSIMYLFMDVNMYTDKEIGWAHDIVWVITARALFWVGEFRRAMLQDCPNMRVP